MRLPGRFPTFLAPAGRLRPATVAAAAAMLLLIVGACGDGSGGGEAAGAGVDSAAGAVGGDSAAGAGPPTLVGVITGLSTPESVLHDADQDVYFISMVNGNPSQKDGNGALVRVHADSLDRPNRGWVRNRPAAPLNAPKGMAIVGDTLWVADIDAVRGYNRRTGRSVGSVALDSLGAVFLNDIAVGPDGALYVTDTGIRFTPTTRITGADDVSRVYRIADRRPAVAVEGPILSGPNGIVWDSAGRRFIIAPFSGPTLLAWSTDGRPPNPRRLAPGPGSYDGIGILPDGRVAVTTWADSTLYAMQGDSALTPLITGIEGPADFGVDRGRDRILIPLFNAGRVVVYRMR
ncbi:MAG: SMP-30/gluconolactonase/LRE family protein [Gemmatimonadaceae bacterium]